MEGTYPIVIDGEIEGTLTVSREGLMTVFSARCRDTGALLRLSVYGQEGGEGYLGVMLPEGGELCLTRRLSRASLSCFPERISRVGEAGRPEPCAAVGAIPASEPKPEPEHLAELEPEEQPEPEPEPELEPDEQPEPPGVWEPPERFSAPANQPEALLPEGDIVWRRGRFGVLRSGEPDAELVAVPLGAEEAAASDFRLVREIEGERYAVFQVKNGKLI